eukprot:2499352-Rhodomonas_salina.1
MQVRLCGYGYAGKGRERGERTRRDLGELSLELQRPYPSSVPLDIVGTSLITAGGNYDLRWRNELKRSAQLRARSPCPSKHSSMPSLSTPQRNPGFRLSHYPSMPSSIRHLSTAIRYVSTGHGVGRAWADRGEGGKPA